MKKIILGLFIFMLFLVASAPLTFAQKVTSSPTNAPTEKPQQMMEEKEATESPRIQIIYSYPYPGILPDNPLYVLKALRDKIISMLTNDPVKKAEFKLLTSDKRIYAAMMLADRGKGELAITTLSKSNNYFHEAVGAAGDAKRMGKDVDTVLHNLKLSIQKHQETLSSMKNTLDKDFSSQLQNEENRMIELEKSLNNLAPK